MKNCAFISLCLLLPFGDSVGQVVSGEASSHPSLHCDRRVFVQQVLLGKFVCVSPQTTNSNVLDYKTKLRKRRVPNLTYG